MERFARAYSEESTKYVIENRKYKKSTIAFLEAFLKQFEVNNTLNRYLSPLSEYNIPRMEDICASS